MSVTSRRLSRLALIGALATSCFSGEGTLGGVCEQPSDCGQDQGCERSICGACGDGVAQSGEVCFDEPDALVELSAEETPVTAPGVIDLDANGRFDLVWASEAGVGVALADEGGLAAPTWVGSSTSAVWTGVDAEGAPRVLSRDSAGAAIFWRPDVSGALPTEGASALASLQNVRAAVVSAQYGVVGAVGETLLVVDPERPEADPLEVELGVETQALIGPVDLDGDGFEDLYAWTADGDVVSVHGSSGEAPRVGQTFSLPARPYDMVATLWNRDARSDLVVLGQDRTVRVLLAAEAGSTEMTEVERVSVAAGARHLAVVDLNADTEPDVLLYGPEAGRMWMLLGRGAELDRSVVLEDDGDAAWAAVVAVGPDPFADVLRLRGGTLAVFEGTP